LKELSIIIPALDEEASLNQLLPELRGQFSGEILLVDGGSGDSTIEQGKSHGCLVLRAPQGRGAQMNAGAARASGELLLFLHADTRLPRGFATEISETMSQPGVAAGAFSLAIDSPKKSLKYLAMAANLRAKAFGLPYGDQAIFTRRATFAMAGCYPEQPIMEDFIFIEKVKGFGRIIILESAVTTSARRWENLGLVRTTLINQLIVIGHRLGVPPARLARWYQRLKGL
jgi:rSAM/selenodomain-associated transferase 2